MKYILATEKHDAALRAMARQEAMPGWVRLAFARDPAWRAGLDVLGHVSQTMVALDDADTVVGCGVRAIRKVYINGISRDIGYLCSLRTLPRIRGTLALAHAYRFFQRLHEEDGLVPAYLSTIVEGNTGAEHILTSKRASLPTYQDYGRYISSAVLLGGRGNRRLALPGIDVVDGKTTGLDAILAFLSKEGPRRQFFPVVDGGDFKTAQWRGFDPSSFRVATCGGRIVGVTGVWDQSSFRQAIVAGYALPMRMGRSLVNTGLAVAGYRPLPRPGQSIPFLHAVLTCVRDDDPAILAALLGRICSDFKHAAYAYVVVGMHERDPLRNALRHFVTIDYASRLFLVRWENGRSFCDTLDPKRVPHVESGQL
jgi:hypothetical protein